MLRLKKAIIAMLASVMLAGALSAVSGADTVSSTLFVIVGEGSSPMPATPPVATDVNETSLLDNN